MEKESHQQNKTIKRLLLALFILSIASIQIALIIVAISVHRSPIPEFPGTMVEHMWKFFLLIPIPLVSVVLGFIYTRKGYKCLKNIIAGGIMIFLLYQFGSFTGIFADKFSHDMSYLHDISNTVNFDFPEDGYISVEFDYMEEGSSLVMVKVNQENAVPFVAKLNNDPNWKRDISFIPANAIDPFTLAMTLDYDYFAVYNLRTHFYNNFPGRLIFMAFDVETNIVYIYTQG